MGKKQNRVENFQGKTCNQKRRKKSMGQDKGKAENSKEIKIN